MSQRARRLVIMLRLVGLLDFCALIAVMVPHTWIEQSHRFLGLGEFPTEPIAGYLARCTSAWYASYGLLLWYVSFDVERYSRLIAVLAGAMIVQGIVIVGIDLAEGMPQWWTMFEGPCCSGLGAILLLLHRHAIRQ